MTTTPVPAPLHVLIVGIGSVTRNFARNWPEPVLARALVARGHRVTAVGYHDPRQPAMAARHEQIDGIDVRRVTPRVWPGPEFGRALAGLPRPDVMHIFHLRNVLVYNAVRWARRHGVPVVHTPMGPFHDAYLVEDRERPYTSQIYYDHLAFSLPGLLRQLRRDPRPRRQVTNYLLHAPLRQVDRFLAASRHELEIFARLGFPRARCDLVPLWIEPLPEILPDETVLAGVRRPIMLFIGQLTPRKGCDLLVEALPAVVAHHPTATLVVVSHNPAAQAGLQARAAALGVAPNLHFAGRVSEEQKRALMCAAACMAIPSRYEGFGLPVLEALQAGVPLVASHIPVVDELVRDGQEALLVPPEDPVALAAALVRLLDDSGLCARLVAAGGLRLRQAFDQEALLGRVLAAYDAARSTRR